MAGTKIQNLGTKSIDVVLEIGLGTRNLTKKLLEVTKLVIAIKLNPHIQAPVFPLPPHHRPRHVSSQGMTPLMHATRHGHVDAVRLLVVGAPWIALSPSGLFASDLPMEDSHQDAFDILLIATI